MKPNFNMSKVCSKVADRPVYMDVCEPSFRPFVMSQVAYQAAGVCPPGFCSMKRLVVFRLPPGWDASLPQH